MNTSLACPNCKSTRLRSDEVAAIGYPVTMTRDADGTVAIDYTGDGYTVFDEGTVYSGDIWCLDCGDQLAESDLIPEAHDMRPCGHPEDMCEAPGCCTDCGGRLAWDGAGGYEHA